MARASLSALITRIREMIGDDPVDEDCQKFTDDSLQTYLDAHRYDMEYVELCPVKKISPGGDVSYFTWFGGVNWETDVEFTDSTYNVITATISDYQNGRFKFETSQSAVLASGKVFDVYGAAADALEAWAAKLVEEFDFAPGDGQSFKRSQKREGKLLLAKEYRAKQRPRTVSMTRSDTV